MHGIHPCGIVGTGIDNVAMLVDPVMVVGLREKICVMSIVSAAVL